MHVTLCVSGKFTGIDFTDLLRERLPHESFYTATYTGSDYDADFYMDEPEITYHPTLDVEPYPDIISHSLRNPDIHNIEWTRHWYKQILLHNHMMKNIPECDVVIRTRFETVVSDIIDWNKYITQSHECEIPIGFNTRFGNTNKDYLYHNRITEGPDNDTKFFIMDALIIHPYHVWDCDLVDSLYKEKKLRGAEEGWYQILSEPSGRYHKSYHGGAYSAKDWELVLDVDKSLHN